MTMGVMAIATKACTHRKNLEKTRTLADSVPPLSLLIIRGDNYPDTRGLLAMLEVKKTDNGTRFKRNVV